MDVQPPLPADPKLFHAYTKNSVVEDALAGLRLCYDFVGLAVPWLSSGPQSDTLSVCDRQIPVPDTGLALNSCQTWKFPAALPVVTHSILSWRNTLPIWVTSWENLFMPNANNKGADQPAHPRSLISTFVVHCLNSVIPLVSISEISSLYSAAAKTYFFKWVQPAVRHRLTYIKRFALTSSLRKPMLTTWHFGAGGDILGQKPKNMLFDKKKKKKCEKLELHYKTVEVNQWVVISRGSHPNVS